MKRIALALAVMGTVSVSGIPRAAAAGLDTDDRGRYGSPVGDVPFDREIKVDADTRTVTVWRLEIVRFVTADGRTFLWRFDDTRPDVFPLARIAPAGVSVPAGTTVYVRQEIPIAP
jgi:hypothetical protein